MINDKKAIVAIKAHAPKSYESIDLDRLAVYALTVLDSKKIPLYFDYAAVALFRLFPKKFSMANFSQYPDTNRINKALRRLTDQARRGWATGTVENGFSLTDLGREVGRQVLEIINNPEKHEVKKIVSSRSRGRSADAEINEIKNSETYKKWENKELINNYEFYAFLKAAPYTPKPLLVEHLDRLKKSAIEVKDKVVQEFLSDLDTKFNNLLK